ncbi:MAG: hypothetical protein C5B50_19755 [Verrucomicrobia bacterium]|nr:MAG: hypothetical protein C5B50_19755 [Verrucomicrobiota bacterium]
MKIQPIVEGHGEVEAVPVLLRRLRDQAQAFSLDVGRPIRRKRWEFVDETAMKKAVRLAMLQPDCAAVLIMFDADDDCPKELVPTIEAWAKAEAGPMPCAVVIPNREYEAWFIASIESLRGKSGIRADAESHPSPETPRGAKGQLESRMVAGLSYAETVDQAPLTAAFDFALAHSRCRSFRRMAKAFGILAAAAGFPLTDWPPAAWIRET